MIGRLTGVLLEKNPPQVLVDVGGVGYEVEVPMSSFYNLPETGAKVTLLTQFVVREDAQLLYGFLTQKERLAFRQLIKVSGIGAKSALGILSGLSVDDLSQAIAAQDIALLVRIPGIGKKTAERMLLELRDKFSFSGSVSAVPSSTNDVLNALLALGYNDREALAASKLVPAGTGVSEGIRLALKSLSKS
ncbi:MAG: Holliday junction branch migration protein RuvA [Methylophilales bacterium]|nr:Holliday junction branch migration protein RuvA [Methylophilales bacterium]